MIRSAIVFALALSLLVSGFAACGGGGSGGGPTLLVNSLGDEASPPDGTVTLRSALAEIPSGGRIGFDPSLDGGTISLATVGETNSILIGESFPMGKFAGYVERDYGPSALYAAKDVTIDASALPHGITLAWTGGEANPARVLAVRGDLTLRNLTLTGGVARAAATAWPGQAWTLGRGGAVAVWGTAILEGCTLHGNRAEGDLEPSRDRGSFGGGIYGNRLILVDDVIAGNRVEGYGAAGGGVYSVGGAGLPGLGSRITRCAINGNRVTGQHAYGGGVYSDGGGPGNTFAIVIEDSTLARNVVEDHPGLDEPAGSQYYYRGGGFYMSNGSLALLSSTIAENEVTGPEAVFRGRPNTGGGGIAATIGDAHVVDTMQLRHSIVAGNTVNGEANDVYSGSLLHFTSDGCNLVGRLDLSQILVPVPPWWSVSRKHWPKNGDAEDVALADVLDLAGAETAPGIVSAGTDAGSPVLLAYPPTGPAVDRVPSAPYVVDAILAEVDTMSGGEEQFLDRVVERLRIEHADVLGEDFGATLPPTDGIIFVEVSDTWPSEPANGPWIAFWRALDEEIGGRLGAAGPGDAFWAAFTPPAGGARFTWSWRREYRTVRASERDQRGRSRPANGRADVGAIER